MKRVAQKKEKVEFKGARCYVGVDVHKMTYYVAILSEEGFSTAFSSPSEPQLLIKQLENMGIEILCLAHESGPTGYELAWYCQEAGIPVIIAASSKIPRKITADGKTDRLDAIKLAEYLAKNMLKGITIPTREEHSLRELERCRQKLVRSRMKIRQEIKSLLLRNKITAPKGLEQWSLASVTKLKEMPLGNLDLRLSLDSYLRHMDFICLEINEMRKALSKGMEQQGKESLIRNLRTIPGVGETISHTFAAEIFRPERFERQEEICAYVGLAPITSQSGQSRAKARLHRVGQGYLRSILVESAWILIMKEESYRHIYNKIISRTNLPQKAIVAVARRLLIIMWRVAVEDRAYRAKAV